DHTWRNAPAIMGLVNQVMGQAQDAGEFDGFRSHSTESKAEGAIYRLPRISRDSAESSDATATDAAVWRDSLTTPRRIAEETRKTQECRQAARWLAQQLQGGMLKPSDTMVLARKRERLGLMQAELAALHIPAQQPEKNDLYDMPEVQDLVALLDVLVSPAHDLSLARALKSPVFGASDDDLVQLVLRQRALRNGDTPLPWLDVLLQPTDSSPLLPDSLVAAGQALAQWKEWVATLPPHDALAAIYHHGDVLARYAAASPATQRESTLANLRALLAAALQVDGGRYTTAYTLVRALRAGGIPAPVRADAAAVRLLTIHGAKGLEAPLVLLLDTDGESIKAQTMGVLVDWPGEAAYPQRLVFLASESRPPACVADALATEQAARKREELNALYVTLTRTQQTLVVSSLQPHIPNVASWWQRLHAQAQDAPWLAAPDDVANGLPATSPDYPLLFVPNLPLALVNLTQAATKTIVNAEQPEDKDSLDSRIGQAMHRLLERYVPVNKSAIADSTWPAPVLLETTAQEFALDAAQIEQAQGMAQTIVQGEGAWAWDANQLAWQGNEVAVVHHGRLLRLDRLVQRRSSDGSLGQWWVLDYKSTSQPHLQSALREQLLVYRTAVAQAHPQHPVRAAFLTAQGSLIEIDAP
ncbi:MAG: 3'-5' exonuclease, partial [Rhodoferax sp.]